MFDVRGRETSADSGGGGSRRRRKPIAVVLGAGAARGWAHIGALRELDRMDVKPDIVVGSSIGALVGGCYAAGKLDELENFALSLTKRRVFGFLDISLAGGGLIGGDRLRAKLEESLADTAIEALPIRFAGVATEIGTGHEVWLRRGPLVEAMRASYALPGIFEPVRIGDRWLFDGAIVNPVPISVARALGADRVIALNVAADNFGRGAAILDADDAETDDAPASPTPARAAGVMGGLRRGADIIRRQFSGDVEGAPGIAAVMVEAFNITQDRIMRSRLAGDPPDALITMKVGRVGLFEFHRAEELIALGAEAVRKASGEILHLLAREPTSSGP